MRRAEGAGPVEAGPKKHQSRKAQMRAHIGRRIPAVIRVYPQGSTTGTLGAADTTRPLGYSPARMATQYPQRIVCLTEETTETLYLLGEEWRIVGISGFTVRPPRARREKPRVSAFTSAKIERILELEPDLVLGFSDLQAGIAADLARAGLEVHVFNHRSVAEIFRMIRTLGGMIGCEAKTATLVEQLQGSLDAVRTRASELSRRP